MQEAEDTAVSALPILQIGETFLIFCNFRLRLEVHAPMGAAAPPPRPSAEQGAEC